MSKRVEIYTKPYCAFCQRAKDLLRIKGVEFVEHDITDDHYRAAEMQQRSSKAEVPGIFINGHLVGGCLELFELDESGALDALLGLSGAPDESVSIPLTAFPALT